MNSYKVLKQQKFESNEYSIVPVRLEDRYAIMQWRNEQIYHLRQNNPLTKKDQDKYFEKIIPNLFFQERPNQILFSYLKNNECIGYGGLVHINWIDHNAEISFIMNTSLEKNQFELHWTKFLTLLDDVAFKELNLHKIFTFAFDLRPQLYPIFEKMGFKCEAILKEHVYFENKFISAVIHSKLNLHK